MKSKHLIAILGVAALALGAGIGTLIAKAGGSSQAEIDAEFTKMIIENQDSDSLDYLYFENIDDANVNIYFYRPENIYANTFAAGIDDDYGHIVWDGTVKLADGRITTVGSEYDLNMRVITPYHLKLDNNGKENDLYQFSYLNSQADKVEMEKLRNRAGDELEVQIFEIDGHRIAKTNLYGFLTLDSNNTARTTRWFPGSDEGQETTVKFEPGCVTLTFGRRNNTIVYGDNQNSSDYISIDAFVLDYPNLKKITLDPQGGNRYDALNLFDENPSTAWAIGEKKFEEFEKETEGHYPRMVAFQTIQQYPAYGLTITNGYAKSEESWRNNARAKNITIMGCSEGSNLADNLYSGTLSDKAEPQTIKLNKTGRYDYYNLIIEDFYPGEKCNDVCISEIEVFVEP